MNMTQLPFVVEGILILAAMLLGGWLGRKGRPYGKVKLGFHIFFWLWMSMGYYYISAGLFSGKPWTMVDGLTAVMGVALLTQVGTGLVLLVRKERPAALPKVHGVSAALLLLADLGALIAAGLV